MYLFVPAVWLIVIFIVVSVKSKQNIEVQKKQLVIFLISIVISFVLLYALSELGLFKELGYFSLILMLGLPLPATLLTIFLFSFIQRRR